MVKRPNSRLIPLLFVLICLGTSFSPFFTRQAWAQRRSGGSVRVHGYVRKDGTYVAPHRRSAPDGNFYNNSSTKGNMNPYTGEEGKKIEPPLSSGRTTYRPVYTLPVRRIMNPDTERSPKFDFRLSTETPRSDSGFTRSSGMASFRNSSSFPSGRTATGSGSRASLSAPAMSTTSDWLEAQDKDARIRMATELRTLGRDVDWRQYSYLDMSDQAARIRMARELKMLGVSARWENHDYLEMSDWANRIRISRDLNMLGLDVNWRKYDYLQMSDMASRIRIARDLARKGIQVDWRQHSYLDMSERLHQAR